MTSRHARRSSVALALAAAGTLALTACGGGGGGFSSQSTATQKAGPANLKIMIGSSGDAETAAVKAAADSWAKKSGNTVEVIAASDLGQQLGQAFAGGTPPDVFYTDASRIGDFAKAGNLYAYGDQVKDAGFLPSLVQTFTYDGKLQCAPKDYSTLGLVINTDMWAKAGLTDADIPKDWAGLETVAKKLTKGKVTGLVIGNDINRGGAFMVQAGGWVVNKDGSKVTADTPQNLAGLNELKKMMAAGSLKFMTDTNPAAGWGGEALGKGAAAMTPRATGSAVPSPRTSPTSRARSSSCRPDRRARGRSCSATAGVSPPRAHTRARPSTWSSPSPASTSRWPSPRRSA
jgi:multiple sugar transport system substrate-binding protein